MAPQAGRGTIGVARPTSVLSVHVGLVVGVAVEASEYSEIVCLFMAGTATRPLTLVSSRKDREIIRVVIEGGTSPGDAVVAYQTFGRVSGTRMLTVVGTLVTGYAITLICRREQWLTGSSVVTTGARQRSVRAGQVESTGCDTVIKRGITPRGRRVTGGTCCGVTHACMLRVIFALVAGDAVVLIERRIDGYVGDSYVATHACQFGVHTDQIETTRN